MNKLIESIFKIIFRVLIGWIKIIFLGSALEKSLILICMIGITSVILAENIKYIVFGFIIIGFIGIQANNNKKKKWKWRIK